MLCKRSLCWVCPLSSQKRSFLVSNPDLDCGAEFFGDDLASYRNSSISCFVYNSSLRSFVQSGVSLTLKGQVQDHFNTLTTLSKDSVECHTSLYTCTIICVLSDD